MTRIGGNVHVLTSVASVPFASATGRVLLLVLWRERYCVKHAGQRRAVHHLDEVPGGVTAENVSCSRLMDFCMIQIEAQGRSRTCVERDEGSKESKPRPRTLQRCMLLDPQRYLAHKKPPSPLGAC